MLLRVVSGQRQHNGNDDDGNAVLENKTVEAGEIGQQAFVLVLVDLLIGQQHERGQHQNDRGDAEHHALHHHHADVAAERQAHEAQRGKARDCGEA